MIGAGHSSQTAPSVTMQPDGLVRDSGKISVAATGASRGIGAEIAKALAAEGADVAITYEKSADRAAEVVAAIKAKGRKAVAIQADSADVGAVQASVEKTAAELGGLDILVNNAGFFE
jgi:3-oxoacyl-[acyl-carrier protein] reductase